jgi:hypothetical protein
LNETDKKTEKWTEEENTNGQAQKEKYTRQIERQRKPSERQR